MPVLSLPTAAGGMEEFSTSLPRAFPETADRPFNRVAYAAAHVVPHPVADNAPWIDTDIDWDRTIAFRSRLWDLGLGVAEAMDTCLAVLAAWDSTGRTRWN